MSNSFHFMFLLSLLMTQTKCVQKQSVQDFKDFFGIVANKNA